MITREKHPNLIDNKTIITFILSLLSALDLSSQTADADSIVLKEITVEAPSTNIIHIDSAGVKNISIAWFARMPKVLGNPDPMRLIQTLPGVHTNTEYEGNIHIDGGEASHTAMLLGGAPVYGVSHMLGFFSIFNPTHFHAISLRRNTFDAMTTNRLGAEVNMLLPDSMSLRSEMFEGSIGLISAQGTLRHKITYNSGFAVSARRSFLNLMYGSLLKMSDMSLNYNFGDYNISAWYNPTIQSSLSFNFYYGNDGAVINGNAYQTDMKLKWGNLLAQVGWKYSNGRIRTNSTAYVSCYDCKMDVSELSVNGKTKSNLVDIGYIGSLSYGNLDAILRVNHYIIQPLAPKVDGIETADIIRSNSTVITLGVQYSHNILTWLKGRIGIKAHLFAGCGSNMADVDPSIGLTVAKEWLGTLDISIGSKTQHLSQTGFVSRGWPSEFWISPCETRQRAQRAVGIDISWRRNIVRDYSAEVGLYAKRMTHQVEYQGDLLSLLSYYNLNDCLLFGKGYNLGVNVILGKNSGRITGWIGYSWQRLRRQFDRNGMNSIYPSSHERAHELNIVANWRITHCLDFGASFVYASGTPFTPCTEMYMINSNVIMQYGEYNSMKLPPYMRIDVSLNYNLPALGKVKHGLNLSVYNLTARNNAIYCRFKYNSDTKSISYSPISFVTPILPSISYYIKF